MDSKNSINFGRENPAFELEPRQLNGKDGVKNEHSRISSPNKILPIDENENQKKSGSLPKISIKSDNNEEDLQCGLGFIHPEWIQRFATRKYFMIAFSLLGVVQGMTWSYFSATITTLEKRFKISSQTTGVVMTGNEVSQIVFSLILAYYGGKGHRPRWIAVGVLCSAVACFLLASPHAFYGSGEDALSLTEEYSYLYENVPPSSSMMASASHFSNISTGAGAKKGRINLCHRTANVIPPETCNIGNEIVPLILIFLSQFVSGIGILLFFSLGGPYLDDNTKKKNVPLVFGITMSLRLVGPTIGYVFASGTLKMYVNPLLTPQIASDDPRWIGAWWLGWIVFGTLMAILSFIIALFPRKLRNKDGTLKKEDDELGETVPKFSDIPKAVKSLLKNKVNLFNSLAGVFYIFSAIGYWTYMPKYMETIFMQTASSASVISGAVGILCQSTGMLLSGYLISKFQPSARKLAAWNVVLAFLYVGVTVIFTQIGCDVGKISVGQTTRQGEWNLTSSCNADCNCKVSKIFPVCYKEENTVFYSACHAGCSTFENNTISNCTCLPDPKITLSIGNCSEGCLSIFMVFLGINAIIKLLEATGRIGNMLIQYRCVDVKDRSLSIGLSILLVSLLAFLPSPILFGAIIDSVCLVWGGKPGCGKKGNCMLYNGAQLRYVFNLTAAAFTFLGGLFDCLVLYYVKDLELYKELEPETTLQKDKDSTERKLDDNNRR